MQIKSKQALDCELIPYCWQIEFIKKQEGMDIIA